MRKKYKNSYMLKLLLLCIIILPGVSCWDGLNDMLEEAGSPSAIMFTQSSLTSGGMTINWTDPAFVTGYDHIIVTYTPGSPVTLNKGVTSFNVSGLVSSTEYKVTVQAMGKENIIKAQSSFKVTPSGSYTLRFIYTAADLDSVRSNLGDYYVVMNDIDLSGFANWTPIGTANPQPTVPFAGVFDCQNYFIRKININTGSINNLGLFGNSSGLIKNCHVEGIIIGTSSNSFIAGLAGVNSGTISNCSASISLTGSGSYCWLGGLAGNNSGTVTNCYSAGNISGTGAGSGSIISNSGGLIALTNNTITGCYSTADVSGSLINCRYGGLVGTNTSSIAMENCYATGKVTTTTASGTFTGGLIGSNNNNCAFNDCYATGYVNGGNYKGGLVGQDFGSSAFTSCYYNSETSGQSDTGKGEPRTTNQMKLIDTSVTTYSGWDFTAVWGISSGINGGYPYLRAVAP